MPATTISPLLNQLTNRLGRTVADCVDCRTTPTEPRSRSCKTLFDRTGPSDCEALSEIVQRDAVTGIPQAANSQQRREAITPRYATR